MEDVVEGGPDPAETFSRFLAVVERLVNEPLVRNGGLHVGFEISGKRGQDVRFEARHPDETQLRSYLLTFRQLTSQSEPVFVSRVKNLCAQNVRSDELKERLQEGNRSYATALKNGPLSFVVDGEQRRPEQLLDLWVNGYYFHNDERKAAELDKQVGVDRLMSRHLFLDLVVEATRFILLVRNVIVVARAQSLLA